MPVKALTVYIRSEFYFRYFTKGWIKRNWPPFHMNYEQSKKTRTNNKIPTLLEMLWVLVRDQSPQTHKRGQTENEKEMEKTSWEN